MDVRTLGRGIDCRCRSWEQCISARCRHVPGGQEAQHFPCDGWEEKGSQSAVGTKLSQTNRAMMLDRCKMWRNSHAIE